MLVLSLAGCPVARTSPAARPDLREPTRAPATITVTLDSHDARGRIADAQVLSSFGCTGDNRSPALHWSPVAEARSYALIMHDLDAPTGVGFFHWVVVDVPADTTALASGASGTAMPGGALETHTDFGAPGYGGPCPPAGRAHRYEFTVYALDVPSLGVPAGATAALVRFMVSSHVIALGRTSATYER